MFEKLFCNVDIMEIIKIIQINGKKAYGAIMKNYSLFQAIISKCHKTLENLLEVLYTLYVSLKYWYKFSTKFIKVLLRGAELKP